MFSIDIRNHIDLAANRREAAKRVRWATAFFLTELAWKGRAATLEELPRRMTIRNMGFVKKNLYVSRANGRSAIEAQEAIIGTKPRARFSGWREQAEGGERKRFATYTARLGNPKRQIAHKFRLKGNFISPSDLPQIKGDKGAAHRAHVFLRVMSDPQVHQGQPFKLFGHPTLPSGIYLYERGVTEYGPRGGIQHWPTLRALQLFEHVRVRPNDWRQHVIDILSRRVNTAGLWERCLAKSNALAK